MKRPASEYFARNIWISANPEERMLPLMIEFAGLDRFFIGSDYLHAEGFVSPVAKTREGCTPSWRLRFRRCSTTTPKRSMESNMANIEELTAQTQRLEDIENIKQLKARYCAFCDDNYNPQGIASLFTEDGVWDGGEHGKAKGHDAIVKFFQRAPSVFSFAIHHVMNPIIKVQGDIATGRWYLLQPLTRKSREGETAMWLAGRYEDEYVRVGNEWKFKRLKFITRFLARYDEEWARGHA
jgi:hypothetical protein